jgi:uncharacterized protein YecE (DUF72 family)
MAGRLLLGTSGYAYGHWRGVLYPPRLPSREWLHFYARHFASVELNNPFYRLPSKAVFRAWRAAVPDDFLFAVKASRFLTHLKRLKAPTTPLCAYFNNDGDGAAVKDARSLGELLEGQTL